MAHDFTKLLEKWGPQASYDRPSLREAEEYCRQLSRSHYENFSVASWFLPKHLLQPFYNIYAYCRWADDLADEAGDANQSLALLEWWERELTTMEKGDARHPVFVAIAKTVQEFQIPREPFADLLVAFRQDQIKTRYESWEELLEYCRYSANPVGRLVLYLGRCHNEQTVVLSDQICKGLQLANFWQDVSRDWNRGRVYIPQDLAATHGYTEDSPQWGQATDAFRELMKKLVFETESFFIGGRPLVSLVSKEIRMEVDLFIRGGMELLDSIRKLDYDVWSQRPTISKWKKLTLLTQAWWNQSRRAS